MATNQFKPFATATGANVTSQNDYENLPSLASGFSSGKASSAQINKALRQGTSMAAMLGQFILSGGLDASDNGNVNTLLSNFLAAMKTNLSLGTAATKNTGVADNDIPDMSKFSRQLTNSGYQRIPGGLILQWGTVSDNSVYTFNFPLVFPTSVLGLFASADTTIGADLKLVSMVNTHVISRMQGSVLVVGNDSGTPVPQIRRVHWLAIGF